MASPLAQLHPAAFISLLPGPTSPLSEEKRSGQCAHRGISPDSRDSANVPLQSCLEKLSIQSLHFHLSF